MVRKWEAEGWEKRESGSSVEEEERGRGKGTRWGRGGVEGGLRVDREEGVL